MTKSPYQSARDSMQQAIYAIIDPFIRLLLRCHVTPNMVTTTGLVGNLLAAVLIIVSALTQPCPNLLHLSGCGLLILFASLFDMLDGRLARTGNLSTTFGAFYDSVLDRYCELCTLSALALLFMNYRLPAFALATLFSLIGSLMVSYVRARAEGLGAECKVGLMQRPERVVLTALGLLLAPLFRSLWAVVVPQILIALLANYTAIVRILHVRKQL